MTVDIRPIHPDELTGLRHLDAVLFGYAEDAHEHLAETLEPDRIICAYDGGRMVGSAAALSLEITVPGGAQVAMAGVTWVGVLTTHRRQGIMNALVREVLARAPEPAAGLGASESLLYRRFGFGPATRSAHVEIETARASFRQPLQDHGSLRLVDLDEALALLPDLHARVRLTRNGMLRRDRTHHVRAYHDADAQKSGSGPVRFVAHHAPDGEVDGVVAYRFRLGFDDVELFDGDLRVVELLATSDETAAALWRFCLDHDLCRRLVAGAAPVDDPVVDRLADPRRWTQRPTDQLHLRPGDVAALLRARRYGRDDSLVLEIVDPLDGAGGGRFRLEGGLEAAACEPADAGPDLVMGSAALGSIYLGDVAVDRLWRAGLVEERTPGAVRRATAMFAWSPAPWLSYMF